MKRFITLNNENIVIGIRFGESIATGEIESSAGDIGQLRNPDGTFSETAQQTSEESQLDRIESTLDLLLLKQEGIIA